MSDLFEQNNKKRIKWYQYLTHGGYYFINFLRYFFSKPFKETRRDIDILGTVGILLDSEATDENIWKCKELTRLHRIVENTRARRRLEKWSLKVIATYLFIVFLIVVANYCKIVQINVLNIPDSIMITILSTTTINIIGLGLIVLRGFFLVNDDAKEDKRQQGLEKT